MQILHTHKIKHFSLTTGVVRFRRNSLCILVSLLFIGVIGYGGYGEYKNQLTGDALPPDRNVHAANVQLFRYKTYNLLSFVSGNNKPKPDPVVHTASHKVITTIFWVGEEATADNGFIANSQSAWDGKWAIRYGGVDDPYNRTGYYPAGFIPKENPFYFALPYNDFTNGKRRSDAANCPNAKTMASQPYSWCKNTWIKVVKGAKTVYAQWEDVGPYAEYDASYVFGGSQPTNTLGAKAGLDVSPAVRDYLGLKDVDTTEWSFVDASQVPNGPWKDIVTTSLGYSL